MKHPLFCMPFVFGILLVTGCTHDSPRNASDSSDSDQHDIDASADMDTDTDTDIDTGADADADGDLDSADPESLFCKQLPFPPANEPDGCRRILLTQNGEGWAFGVFSSSPAISQDGNVAVFMVSPDQSNESLVDGLPEDTNTYEDIYAADLKTMALEMVSVSIQDQIADGASGSPSISAAGRFVAFVSSATNLVQDIDLLTHSNVFVRDRQSKTTELVSISTQGVPANEFGIDPVISADGRFVVFGSIASNLIDGDTNNAMDLFLRDRTLGTTERITAASDTLQTTHISAASYRKPIRISDDGRYVIFDSMTRLSDQDEDDTECKNFRCWDVYRHDRQTRQNTLVSIANDGYTDTGSQASYASPDASRVLFQAGGPDHYYPQDTDVLKTINMFTTVGSSVFEPLFMPEGEVLNHIKGLSTNEQSVAFQSENTGLVEHVGMAKTRALRNGYVYDRVTEEVRLITASDSGRPGVIVDYQFYPENEAGMNDFTEMSMSGDGLRIVFTSSQYGLADGHHVPCPNTPRETYLYDCR